MLEAWSQARRAVFPQHRASQNVLNSLFTNDNEATGTIVRHYVDLHSPILTVYEKSIPPS